jgi:hypothetical protein
MPGLIIYAGTVFTAGCIGVFLVYLQHNFEDTWWDRKPDLNPARAALQGSSALDLGWWWDLGTGNIAYHDIHHFNANIPSYRLRKCHRALREKYEVQTIRWPEAIRSFTLKLWDEDQERLVPFPRERRTAPFRATPDGQRTTRPFILAEKLPRGALPSPATGLRPDGLAHHVPIGRLHRPAVEPPALPVPGGDARQHRDQRHGGELGVRHREIACRLPRLQHRLQPVLVIAAQPLDHREILGVRLRSSM